jgi:hypothetical protein
MSSLNSTQPRSMLREKLTSIRTLTDQVKSRLLFDMYDRERLSSDTFSQLTTLVVPRARGSSDLIIIIEGYMDLVNLALLTKRVRLCGST